MCRQTKRNILLIEPNYKNKYQCVIIKDKNVGIDMKLIKK